ncbi:MAG TPA: hypothetical protein PKK48_09245, partial [Phycisphaerae bacterium]|nr:hypothetical protein [Phycisphaerae bacterium]
EHRKQRPVGGYVYADNGSLFPMFIFGKIYSLADLPPEDLWLAQKSIWIQTDIINAIAEAVKDVFDARKLPDSERNVLNSPIKQLTAINIEKLKSAGSGRGGAMYPGMAEPGYGGTAGGEAVKSDTLTTYGANALFDVANYSFTVVMPTRYLPVLEKKLLKQNYHVILSEEILPVDSAGGSAAVGEGMMAGFGMSGGASSVKAVNGLYNFGTEPVCRITITAQLLLVTSFTRGQWDSAHNMWVSYPLMPVEVMKNMPQTALRPEDRDFIEQFERLGRGEQPVEGRPAIPWYRNDAWRPAKSSEKDARTPGKVQ